MWADFFLLLVLSCSTLVLQLIGLPLVLLVFGKQQAQPFWWAWGRIAGLLAIGIPIWLLSYLQVPANTQLGFWSMLVLLGVGLYAYQPLKLRSIVGDFLREHWRLIIYQELLFLAGFLFLGLVRTYHPAIVDLEKFMNAGLMQSYLRSPTFPPVDMWLSGYPVNYYSFGHFLGSLLLRFWQLPVEIGFNVLGGWMLGLVLLQASALTQSLLAHVVKLTKKIPWSLIIGGLSAAVMIIFGGNSHTLWYFLQNGSFEGYWYPDAVRLIENTIHEIPAYSFIVSDLHAHFWSLVVVLFTIFVTWQWWRQAWQKLTLSKHSFLLGLLLGVLGATNTWDMMIYGILLMMLGMVLLLKDKQNWSVLFKSAGQVLLGAMVVFLPWWWHFTSITNGVFWVWERSPLNEFLILWTGHGLLSLTAILIGKRLLKKTTTSPTALFVIILGFNAWLFLLLPEVIYFKDIYPTFPRANTMFKFTYQAFAMMSILGGWLIGWLWQRRSSINNNLRKLVLVLALFFVIFSSGYAIKGYPSYYGDFQQRRGMNGLDWLIASEPAEVEAINFLRNTTDRPVVLEAVGDSYSTFGRVSVFSGLPTIMGWRAHEWLWRGGYQLPQLRSEEVRTIYEQPLSSAAQKFLDKHQVEFIVIGSEERQQYQFRIEELLQLGEVVFHQENIFVLQRKLVE